MLCGTVCVVWDCLCCVGLIVLCGTDCVVWD